MSTEAHTNLAPSGVAPRPLSSETFQEFRPAQFVKTSGMLFLAVYSLPFAIFSALFFFWMLFPKAVITLGAKTEGSLLLSNIVGLLLFGTMTFASMMLLLTYYRERLWLSESTVSTQSGWGKQRSFQISDIQTLKWGCMPREGKLDFHFLDAKSRPGKFTISLQNYSAQDRLEIITLLQRLVPAEVQKNWGRFCYLVALRLRDNKPALHRIVPHIEAGVITRKRYDWAAAVPIPLSTFLAIVTGLRFGSWQLIGLPLFLTAFWLLLRFSIPIEGLTLYRPAPNTPLDGKTKTVSRLLFVMCIPIILMVAFQVFGIDGPIASGIFLATAAICFACFFYQTHKIDSQRNQIDELGANLAPGFWLNETASQPAKLDPGTLRAEFRTEEV